MYEECNEMSYEYEYRIELKDKAVDLCNQSYKDCVINLKETNDSYNNSLQENLNLKYQADKYKRQRNYFAVGGVCLSIGIILALIL